MDRKIGKLLLILAATVILILVVWMVYPAPPSIPPKPLPNPNGYTNLAEAGRMLSGARFDYPTMSREELQGFLESITNVLQLARTGLQQECRIPVQYSQAYMTAHMQELAGFKNVAQALAAEGRLAEMEERYGDAVKCFLDVVHLGTESGRGGVLIDCLVGEAVQAMGLRSLRGLTSRLDAKACRQAAATLETLDAQRESWNDVMQQERNWSRQTYPGLQYRLAAFVNRRSVRLAEENGRKKFHHQQLEVRQLILDLAARAYDLEKGHKPKAAADLVPEYLKTVPQDPLSGTNLVWIP